MWDQGFVLAKVSDYYWIICFYVSTFQEIWLATSGTNSKKHTLSSSYGVYHCHCSGIRLICQELKELRRLLAGPLCSSFPQFESLSVPVVLIRFGATPFLSSRGLFLQPTVKSLSVGGLMFSNDRALSLRSRLLLLAIPFCLLWASFNDRHFKNVTSWFGGQFENTIWIICARSLMVAIPSCKNRLWMVIFFRRKVFPNGDWLLTMCEILLDPRQLLLKIRRFVTTPLELKFSTVKQHSNSLASITLSK